MTNDEKGKLILTELLSLDGYSDIIATTDKYNPIDVYASKENLYYAFEVKYRSKLYSTQMIEKTKIDNLKNALLNDCADAYYVIIAEDKILYFSIKDIDDLPFINLELPTNESKNIFKVKLVAFIPNSRAIKVKNL